jgi:hypothetical protein
VCVDGCLVRGRAKTLASTAIPQATTAAGRTPRGAFIAAKVLALWLGVNTAPSGNYWLKPSWPGHCDENALRRPSTGFLGCFWRALSEAYGGKHRETTLPTTLIINKPNLTPFRHSHAILSTVQCAVLKIPQPPPLYLDLARWRSSLTLSPTPWLRPKKFHRAFAPSQDLVKEKRRGVGLGTNRGNLLSDYNMLGVLVRLTPSYRWRILMSSQRKMYSCRPYII